MIVSATYHANGGTGSVPPTTYATEGSTVNVLFSPAPTRQGYTFLGWATSASAASATYTADGTKSYTATSADVDLYAVWDAD